MAHFIGKIQGVRGQASRFGTKQSGLTAIANGWNCGGFIEVIYDEKTGEDVVCFFVSGGSNNSSTRAVGRFSQKQIEKMLK